MNRNLYHERSRSALVTLLSSRWGRIAAAVVSPWSGEEVKNSTTVRADKVMSFLDAKSNARGFIDIEDAVAWAGRADLLREHDEQLCLGERFDRHLVADVLAVIRSAGVPGDTEAMVERVALESGPTVRITASFTAAIVCALRPGTLGNDPLPTRPRRRSWRWP